MILIDKPAVTLTTPFAVYPTKPTKNPNRAVKSTPFAAKVFRYLAENKV